MPLNRSQLVDLRGAARMVVDAAEGTAGVVETMHRTIQRRPGPLGVAVSGRTRGITGMVYRSVRGGIRLVGQAIDACLEPVAQWLPEGESSPARDAYRAVANGVYGDYLLRTGNPLAIDMSLRYRGRRVDLQSPASILKEHRKHHGPAAPVSQRLLVLVHGLCMNDRQWKRKGHDHGAALGDELGVLPLYLRYNSGLDISSNGQALAGLLEALIANWSHPVEELTILGHSMGGLVARSACHHGLAAGHAWPRSLRKLIFLGTPHHGAPLERVGSWLDFAIGLSPYSKPLARIGKARSAGITGLRDGRISAAEQIVRLPSSVSCYAVAAVQAAEGSTLSERLVGDGLVPLDSALGRHRDSARDLGIAKDRQWVGYRMGHLDLLHHPKVYDRIHRWLQPSP